MPMLWVLHKHFTADGKFIKRKARLTGRGDLLETEHMNDAPTVNRNTFRTMMQTAPPMQDRSESRIDLLKLDVTAAYLQSDKKNSMTDTNKEYLCCHRTSGGP